MIKDDKAKLFSLNSNQALAEEIATEIGLELSRCIVKQFSDGEIQISIEENIRGCDVYIIQSTNEPGNEYLMELLIMIDAVKRASAKSINVVMPYYGYSRQDRKAFSREPITAKLIANLLEAAGASRIVSVDIHAPQVQGFFNVPVDQLFPFSLTGNYFKEKNLADIVVVAPENAGTVRARQLALRLNASIAFIDKKRFNDPNPGEKITIVGEIEGKSAIIIDDMVDTARTITSGASALMDLGAKEVYACCTHPVLSGPAVDWINESAIKELVTTNTIHLSEEKRIDKITVLSIAPLLAQVIERIHLNESVSSLFD